MNELPDDCIVEIGLRLGEFCDVLAIGLTCKKFYDILSERIVKNRYEIDQLSMCNVYIHENSHIIFSCRGRRAIGAQIFLTGRVEEYTRKYFNRTVIDHYIQIYKKSNTRIYYATNFKGKTRWENSCEDDNIYLELDVDWNTDKITRVHTITKHQMLSYDWNIYRTFPEKFNSAPFREAYEYFYKGTLCDKFFGEYFIRAVELMELKHKGWSVELTKLMHNELDTKTT